MDGKSIFLRSIFSTTGTGAGFFHLVVEFFLLCKGYFKFPKKKKEIPNIPKKIWKTNVKMGQ